MEEITFSEFEKQYMNKTDKRWDFSKFSIMCRKCGSSNVEYANTIEVGSGYYSGEYDVEGEIVVKCHGCGNAFKLNGYMTLED